MGPAETTGIVIVTVAIIQGLLGLTKHLIDKYRSAKEEDTISEQLQQIKDKVGTECGLNERQSGQITSIHELLSQKDADGMPLVYFPRHTWGETQKKIVQGLQAVSETQLKMLGIIERLERRAEKLDQ